MIKQEAGSIINIAAVGGFRSINEMTAMSPAKLASSA